MIYELITESHKVIEIQHGDLALLILIALFVGGFCTDATFCLFRFIIKKIKEIKNK